MSAGLLRVLERVREREGGRGRGWGDVAVFCVHVCPTHPYRGPSLPIADTIITPLAVSSHTLKMGREGGRRKEEGKGERQ